MEFCSFKDEGGLQKDAIILNKNAQNVGQVQWPPLVQSFAASVVELDPGGNPPLDNSGFTPHFFREGHIYDVRVTRLSGPSLKRDYTAAMSADTAYAAWMSNPNHLTVSQIWKTYVVEDGVLKTNLKIGDPAILVPPIAETYASLRWIHLYQCTGAPIAKTQLWSLLKLARKQPKGWEVLCHPLVLLFYQAAASGQENIKFVPEDKTQDNAAREDIQGMFFDDNSYQWRPGFPSEGKDQWGCQKPDISGESQGKGILENEEGIGKALKAVLTHCRAPAASGRWLGSLFVRLEAIWILNMEFEADRLVLLEAAPSFPVHKSDDPGLPLLPTFRHHRDIWSEKDFPSPSAKEDKVLKDGKLPSLQEAIKLEGQPTKGFKAIVNLVDKAATMNGIARTPIEWRWGARWINITDITVLHASHRCCILRSTTLFPGRVLKIGSLEHVKREATLMGACTGIAHVRQLEAQAIGPVRGAGVGLWGFLMKEVYADHLHPVHVRTQEQREKIGTELVTAVDSLHSRGILHRDIKPANILVRDTGEADISDFDGSCLKNEAKEILCSEAGSATFRSSRPQGTPFAERDDYQSLALTFAALLGCTAGGLLTPHQVIENVWTQLPSALVKKLEK